MPDELPPDDAMVQALVEGAASVLPDERELARLLDELMAGLDDEPTAQIGSAAAARSASYRGTVGSA